MDTLASLMEVKLDIREKRTEIPLRVCKNLIDNVNIGANLFFNSNRLGRDATLKLKPSNLFHVT